MTAVACRLPREVFHTEAIEESQVNPEAKARKFEGQSAR